MSKDKITSKEKLKEVLDSIVYDDWLDYPLDDPNITKEEFFKQYDEHLLKMKMQIVSAEYDICIEDDK